MNAPSGGGNVQPKKRRGKGCLLYSLLTVVVLLIVLVGAWFVVVQPSLNNMAKSQLNDSMSKTVSTIPTEIALVSVGLSVPISESQINSLLSSQFASSTMVQNPQVTITPQNFIFNFQVFGFSCSATGVPVVSNGKITATDVTLSGIAALVLTPSDITTIVNNNLSAAVARIQHPVTGLTLKEHEIDVTLGAHTNGGPTGVPTSIPTGIPTVIPTSISTLIP